MSVSVLSSTLLLTLLLLVGLLFFIRASVKERVEVVRLTSAQSELALLNQLQAYFAQRAYQISTTDAEQKQVTFEGIVRPSLILAVFLTVLAAIGLLCLVLVLSILFPGFSRALLAIVLLSPIAGIFYWRGAARAEKVLIKVEGIDSLAAGEQSVVLVTAHRDELAELQRNLPLTPL